ncbi:MAG: GNAT family N-acetyltransferase [Erysipelotrichaceae bacterium]|nr:GNAT family N-acetyltransferase [Erysipelotrichaceae bacterium]
MELQVCYNEQQIEALAACAKEIWNEYFTSLISQTQIDYMVEKFQSAPALKKAIFENSYTYYMVCDNDKPIAYCGIQVQKDRLFLSKLYVKKAYRKQGISSWLLKSCIEYAKKHRCHAIYLTCNKYNENSLAMYHHKGFQIIDTQEAEIGEGFIMDDYILELALD